MASSSSSSSKCQPRPRVLFSAAILSLLVTSVTGFSLTMMSTYKPPVKSSVKKLHDSRFSRDPRHSSERTIRGRVPPTRRSTASSTTKAAYAGAGAYAPPLPTSSSSSTGVASFEKRMREALFGVPSSKTKQRRQIQQRRTASKLPANVKTVESLDDFKTIVGDETEKLVVVRFHATYCRACNAVAPHFYKLASMNPDIVFVDVPVTDRNAVVHQGLGVPSLPYSHIYHPEAGLVEEFKLTRKDIPAFREKLKTYMDGNCDITSEDNAECQET